MKNNKTTSFLVQGSILAIASFASRLIGLLYRIPMTAIIGDVGNNYYSTAYDVYNIMLLISSYSIPIAVSKLVAYYNARGQKKMVIKVFKTALIFATISGVIAMLLLTLGAPFITTTIMKTPQSIFALYVLAPTLVVFAIMGVIRGFFQGLGTMLPTAFSQIMEQIVNAIISIVAAYFLFQYGAKVGGVLGQETDLGAAYGAAGGTVGTLSGAIVSFIILLILFMIFWPRYKKSAQDSAESNEESTRYVLHIIVLTIVPVLLSTTIYNLCGLYEQIIYKNVATYKGVPAHEIKVIWGIYSGKVKILLNLPISMASAIVASAVPNLSKAYAIEDYREARRSTNKAIRFIMVIAFPCAIGLSVLAGPILMLLFHDDNQISINLLRWASIAVIFFSLSTLTNGILQGINRMALPVKHAIIAVFMEILLLTGIEMYTDIGIYGVVLTWTCYGMSMAIMNSWSIRKHLHYKQEKVKTFIIPALASGIMGIAVYYVYQGLMLLQSNALATLGSIVVGAIVYVIVLLLLRGISKEELNSFPGGGFITKIVVKCHLWR